MRAVIFIFLWSVLSFCSGKQEQSKVGTVTGDGSSATVTIGSALKKSDGLIYFSGDNGLSWQNKSNGLPPTASIGLGGIAVSDKDLAIATKEGGVYFFDFQKDEWISVPTDTQIIRNNPGALALFRGQIFIGTQSGGVFFSENRGKSWTNQRKGLASLTIRKLVVVGPKLYAGTNAGLYSYNESEKKWDPEFGSTTLQVNGITEFDGNIFIGTNQGVFANTADGGKEWEKVLENYSVHNISSDGRTIYAMVYNELLSSDNKGRSWQNIQKGMPDHLYTFNVIQNGNSVFAGQWDGVYTKQEAKEPWKPTGNGLPPTMAIPNMQSIRGLIVVSGNERGLKPGLTTTKIDF
jgi:photosystem II stability/assembly factor-like uncharacterized protein